jgi:hypothetical protein
MIVYLLGQVTCLIRRIENLVVEYREVESKSETDWVRGCKVGSCDNRCCLVCLKRLVGRDLALVTNSKLSEVTVIIALPMACVRESLKRVGVEDSTRLGTYILW